jgi:hypothetical protein
METQWDPAKEFHAMAILHHGKETFGINLATDSGSASEPHPMVKQGLHLATGLLSSQPSIDVAT